MKPGAPKSVEFGSGLKQSIRSGDLDNESLKVAMMDKDLPDEFKKSFYNAVDSAMKPGEERWVGNAFQRPRKLARMIRIRAGMEKRIKNVAEG